MRGTNRDATQRGPERPNGPENTRTETVLRELFELLEDYGPAWYTEETHERALAALRHSQY